MGCFWGKRNNNSYVSDNGNTYLGSGYYWSDVFEEYTTADARMECGSVPNNGRGCYIGCTCKSGWDGKKTYGAASSGLNQTGTVNANSASTSNPLSAANVLDAAPSATSAAGDYSATASAASAVVVSSSASGINSGISVMAAGGSCSVSFSDGRYGTTCSKSGTFACPSGYGYSLDSCKKNQETKYQVCSVDSTQTNSTLCYSAGTAKTCSDENPGYVSQCPSGQSGTKVTTSCNTCYKDCKDDTPAEDFYVHISGGGSGITGNGTLGAFIDKGGPLSSVDVFICFTCGVGCLSGTATVVQKLDNLGRYSGCYNNIPEYDGNTCYISGVGLLEDTVYEGDTFTVSGKKYKLICK